MNRLLIVDDEHHIVNWLAELFASRSEMNLEIMKAYSGYETLQLLKTYKMDLILLDIQMPGMSGLEVAEKALADWPSTRIIFLTAHKNFDYLYRANHLSKTSYLLKTEDDENIVSQVRKVLAELQEEVSNRRHLEKAKLERLLLRHLMEQSFLRELVYGSRPMPGSLYTLSAEEESVSPDFSRPVYVMYTQIAGGSYHSSKLHSYDTVQSYLEIAAALLQDKFRFSMLELEETAMLWFFQDCRQGRGEDAVTAFNLLKNISEDMILSAEETLHNTIINLLYEEAVGSDSISHIAQLLYRYGSEQLRQNVPDTSSSIGLSYRQLEAVNTVGRAPSSMDPKSIAQELSFYLTQKDKTSYMTLLHTVSGRCAAHKSMHDLSIVEIYFSIATLLIRYISQYNLEKQIALKTALYPLYYIHDFSDWKSAFRYLTTLSGHLFTIISDTENSRNEQLVLTLERYVCENISRPLSLSDVASCINYNATYVSRLYKQLRGVSLSEYITQTRLNKAAELLITTNESIQNIALETGFDTSQYFSMVFKKARGISPRDFRNLHHSL